MSENDNSKDLNDVSNSNLDLKQIVKALAKIIEEKEDNKEYTAFCKKYIGEDFEIYKIDDLKKIYEIGNGLLNQYFITQGNSFDNDLLIQLQYIVSNIMYNIIIKQADNTRIENKALNNKLERNIKQAENLTEDFKQEKIEIKHMKNDIKSIMTTIISIILAISIIPTAIAGIEKISADYILPFLSSIILFGVIMITFVYSIYQDKLKKSTWVVLAIAIIICICFWIISFNAKFSKDTDSKNLLINEIDNNTEDIRTE